jgi:hypothetical protein
VKWNELYLLICERIEDGTFFGEEDVTVYCAGTGEYYPADSVEVAGEGDVVSPETLVIIIQN